MIRQTLSVRLDGEDISTKRDELRRYFYQSYDLFESLFELLKDDTVFYRKSEPTRHPMIFYFGHTAVFYINKLVIAGVLKERINPAFESIFAVGVDEMSWDEESGRFNWPEVDEVRRYRNEVRRVVDEVITTLEMELPVDQHSPFWAIWMGIEHERIHIETSSVLHRQMPIEYIRAIETFPSCEDSGPEPVNELVGMEGGPIILGKGDTDHGLYGWDNEYGYARFEVEPFEASRYLVSNGEYLPFVLDGGYRDERWWDEEGRKYLSLREATCPPFWIPLGEGRYGYRSLCREMPLPLNWPVEVNALEAEAFCRWKSELEGRGYRLPGEAEWYVMVRECGMDAAIYDDAAANLNMAHYASSVPVDRFDHGKVCDAVGNVWQWTQTPIDGFEGFAPHPWYDDFSTPTFDNKHNLLKGGAWVSTGNEIVSASRYAFRRHFIQHAGFRYVEGGATRAQNEDKVIDDPEIARLCRIGYGDGETFVPEVFNALLPYLEGVREVLVLGCGAGALCMELGRNCDHVTGMDRSARIFLPAVELLDKGRLRYRIGTETAEVRLNGADGAQNVSFYQGDWKNLKPHVKGYDLIVLDTLEALPSLETSDVSALMERIGGRGYLAVLSQAALSESFQVVDCVRDAKPVRIYLNIWERA
ncbi:MAG: 5-histidylcysteine sulfoxide synthase [Sulfuricurvum sp.]